MKFDLHVGIDCDGILRNLSKSILTRSVKHYPKLKSVMLENIDDISDWGPGFYTRFPDNVELANFVDQNIFNDKAVSYDIFRNADPLNGAKEYNRLFKILKQLNARVSICTTQFQPWHRIATLEWLEEHCIEFDSVLLVKGDKGGLGIDWHVDDYWKNIYAISESGGRGVLFKKPWNKKKRKKVKYSVSSLEEFVNMIVNSKLNAEHA